MHHEQTEKKKRLKPDKFLFLCCSIWKETELGRLSRFPFLRLKLQNFLVLFALTQLYGKNYNERHD